MENSYAASKSPVIADLRFASSRGAPSDCRFKVRVAEGSASTHFDFVVRLSEGVGDAQRRRLVTASEEWNCDDEPELDVPTKATWKIAEGKGRSRIYSR